MTNWLDLLWPIAQKVSVIVSAIMTLSGIVAAAWIRISPGGQRLWATLGTTTAPDPKRVVGVRSGFIVAWAALLTSGVLLVLLALGPRWTLIGPDDKDQFDPKYCQYKIATQGRHEVFYPTRVGELDLHTITMDAQGQISVVAVSYLNKNIISGDSGSSWRTKPILVYKLCRLWG